MSSEPPQHAGDEPLEGTPSPIDPSPIDPSPVSPDSPTDSPTDGATGDAAPTEDQPAADGLDLARSAARAASRAPGGPAKKQRKGGDGTFARRRGRSRFSGAHPDDRDPQALGSTLDRLVANRGWDTDLKVQGVFGQWPSLVGAEVADHCTPETLTDGKLVVRTDSTAWATQLRLLAPSLVRRLNQELGHGTVLLIEVLGPHGPSWKKGPRSAGGRGPRDTYG